MPSRPALVRGGIGIVQEEVPEKISEAHTVVHQGRHQDERSAQRSQPHFFEHDQQDGSDQNIHQRRRAGEHHFPEDRVKVCRRRSLDGTGTAERQNLRLCACDHLCQQMGRLVYGSGQVHRNDPQRQTVEDHKQSVVLFRFIHDYFFFVF